MNSKISNQPKLAQISNSVSYKTFHHRTYLKWLCKGHVLFFLKDTLKYAVVAACFGNYKLSAQVVEHIWTKLCNQVPSLDHLVIWNSVDFPW